MALSQLTIFGAGLIGGSIALAARKNGVAQRIIVIDRDETTELDTDGKWRSAAHETKIWLKTSSLTVLCIPVRAIVELLPGMLHDSDHPITDCGSTKEAIALSVKNHPKRGLFVAGHPMAGSPRGGLKNASEELYKNCRWLLCPENSDESSTSLVRQFVESLGAHVIELNAKEHDSAVAITSHVPQVLASVLSVQAAAHQATEAAGPGYASATRVAGGAEEIWRDIFETNGPRVGEALLEIAERIKKLGTELSEAKIEGTLESLSQARALHDPSAK